MERFQWEDLPDTSQRAFTARFGRVLHTRGAPPGLSPGVAARITAAGGPVFLKAVPVRSPAAGDYRREREVVPTLPAGVPAARLLWDHEDDRWLLLAFACIDARPADLSPGGDAGAVMGSLAGMGPLLEVCPVPGLRPIAAKIGSFAERARALLADPPAELADAAVHEKALEEMDLSDFSGSALVHADPHPGNILVAVDGRVVWVDWALSARAAPWVDAALLVPRLIAAGWPPAEAEAWAARHPAWAKAPAPALTGLASVRALFSLERALHGPARLAGGRRKAVEPLLAWFHHRLARTKPHGPGSGTGEHRPSRSGRSGRPPRIPPG
ncbi:phosphotransferase [Nocardiopsis sp. CNT-189]|uniref:phosphotransferase family protein n=1 Tax=Nocardiopsis oceanisediminis TaxID=2816862 RepID=UPI003B340EB2